jgi:hypothetical protein
MAKESEERKMFSSFCLGKSTGIIVGYGGGEYEQITLYTYAKCHNETHYFVEENKVKSIGKA